jgi:hypothetical protein
MGKQHRSLRTLWDDERQRALFSSPGMRKIVALEAQGYRLVHRAGRRLSFRQGRRPGRNEPALTARALA